MAIQFNSRTEVKLISIIRNCGAHKSQELNFQLLSFQEQYQFYDSYQKETTRVCVRERERNEVDYQEKLSISVVISGSHTQRIIHTHSRFVDFCVQLAA